MESAELKENGKRVRHCFPRQEVYHRWIHDDTYVYSNKSYIVSGKYDWLFAFCLNKNSDRNIVVSFCKHDSYAPKIEVLPNTTSIVQE